MAELEVLDSFECIVGIEIRAVVLLEVTLLEERPEDADLVETEELTGSILVEAVVALQIEELVAESLEETGDELATLDWLELKILEPDIVRDLRLLEEIEEEWTVLEGVSSDNVKMEVDILRGTSVLDCDETAALLESVANFVLVEESSVDSEAVMEEESLIVDELSVLVVLLDNAGVSTTTMACAVDVPSSPAVVVYWVAIVEVTVPVHGV